MLADTVRGAGDPMESETDKVLNLQQLKRNHTHKVFVWREKKPEQGKGQKSQKQERYHKSKRKHVNS